MNHPNPVRPSFTQCGLVILFLLFAVTRAFSGATATSPAVDWNVAVLDQVIAGVPAGEKYARIDDMLVPVDYLQYWRSYLAGGPQPNSAFASGFTMWPSGNVYYAFDASVTAANQKVFLDSAAEWATFANLHFMARSTQADYILVTNNASLSGGLSVVGKGGGAQLLQIGPTSWVHGVVVHEIGHALGLVHEHQRSDRDNYVTINSNNVAAGQLQNFVLLTTSQNKGPYDFLSVMHYYHNAFSVNTALDTIVPHSTNSQYLNIMGQRFDPVLSTNDRAGMISIYGAGPGASSVVTNTADSGPGTLRAALYYAYDHYGTTITFNIPNTDSGFSNNVFNILPSDALPSLVNATILDGTSEPVKANANGPQILINGVSCRAPILFVNGLQFKGTNCAARGLVINNYNQFGILITGTNVMNNTVAGCYVGVDPTGTTAVTNAICPIQIEAGAVSNTVGGLTAADRNLISGSAFQGLTIRDAGTGFNVVEGNYIGLNAAGTAALANAGAGVELFNGASSNTIGGPVAGARNIIAGNASDGVFVTGTTTTGNLVEGNYIGLNPAGAARIANGGAGVDFQGGTLNNVAATNVISGNTADGVLVLGSPTAGNQVNGNYIGLNAAGTAALANGGYGVDIQGGAVNNTASGNVISGNTGDGVLILGSPTAGNRLTGNYVGLNPAGAAILANGGAGVDIQGGAVNNTASGNVISGNANDGVLILGSTTSGNLLSGNYVGLNAAGTAALGNGGYGVDVQGGTVNNVVVSNVISGNPNVGVFIQGAFNSVWGNLIGLNAAGTAALGNAGPGVELYPTSSSNTIGGFTVAARNVISGNHQQGVYLNGTPVTQNLVVGNYIGLNAAGTAAVANTASGIELTGGPVGNTIGGIGGGRNFISGNGQYGINVNNGANANVIQGNTIGLNGTNGAAVPNTSYNVAIFAGARSNLVGGVTAGAANLISGGSTYGVIISDIGTTNNTVRGNSIFNNAGSAILLNATANHNLAAPALSSAVVTTNTSVSGTYNGANGTVFQLDFYSDASSASPIEGMTYLGSRSVTGTGSATAFTANLGALVPTGRSITASATDPNGNTSQLSTGAAVTMTSTPNDGVPDAWRKYYFGGTGTTTNGTSYAAGDPDHDGISNLQEFLSGTNPTNAASVLTLVTKNPISVTNTVSINSSNGIVYRVSYSDDLTAGRWDILADQVVGNGTNVVLGDPAAAVTPRRFYRAQVMW
jgi:parallel beta-helix repeat protein